jgi:hypothetical protein
MTSPEASAFLNMFDLAVCLPLAQQVLLRRLPSPHCIVSLLLDGSWARTFAPVSPGGSWLCRFHLEGFLCPAVLYHCVGRWFGTQVWAWGLELVQHCSLLPICTPNGTDCAVSLCWKVVGARTFEAFGTGGVPASQFAT